MLYLIKKAPNLTLNVDLNQHLKIKITMTKMENSNEKNNVGRFSINGWFTSKC